LRRLSIGLAIKFSRGSGGRKWRAGQKNGVQKSSMTSWPHHLPFGNQKRGVNNHQSKEPIVRRRATATPALEPS
jgi:hypothetical protein